MTLVPAVAIPPAAAFARYQSIRPRMPLPMRQGAARPVSCLGELTGTYDLFVLDSFGVLNVGDTPIGGAVARVASLRAAGKRVAVLTNAAAHPLSALLAKYRRLGFDFGEGDVISSRMLALKQLERDMPEGPVSVIGEAQGIEPPPLRRRAVGPGDPSDAVLFLDAEGWGGADHDALARRLAGRSCPVFVANPDLVAPRETGLSLEPGHFAHDLIDRCAADIRFFGKPFGNAFAAIESRFPQVPPQRIVMVGDTLQTDILGGLARGWGTALVTGHGALTGLDVRAAIAESGLSPDWVLPAI